MTDMTPSHSAHLWNEISHRINVRTDRTCLFSTRNRIANEVIDLIDKRCQEYMAERAARGLPDPSLVFEEKWAALEHPDRIAARRLAADIGPVIDTDIAQALGLEPDLVSRADPDDGHWYVVVCSDCYPEATLRSAGRQMGEMPYRDRGERAEWVVNHEKATGHSHYLMMSTDPGDAWQAKVITLPLPEPPTGEG